MKRHLYPTGALIVLLIVSVGGLQMIYSAEASRLDLQLFASSTGNVESKVIVVDDYEDGDFQNNLGGEEGCWSGNGGSVQCNMQVIDNRGQISIQYDVTQTDTYAVAYSNLPDLDMHALDTLWIIAKGAQGGEPVYIELKDCNNNFPKEEINSFLAQGIDNVEWRAAAIPLEEFVDISNWNCIDKVNIIPHSEIGSGQSTIFVNELRLLPARVVVDDFHDLNRVNELGGDSGFWNSDTGFITYSYPQGALKLEYDTSVTNPVIAEAIYWTSLLDSNLLSQKDFISFSLRGSIGSEELALEIRDCGLSGETHITKIKISDYLNKGISTDWQRVSIPLAAFADGLEWQCIEQINFLVSAQPWLNSGTGTIFIDDLILAPNTVKPVPLIVDSFDDCNQLNALTWAWGGGTNDSGSSIDFNIESENQMGKDGCGLQIDYSVSGASGTWVYTDLKGIDVSDYTHLRFWIKGAAGSEELHVYLQDQEGNRRFYEEIKTTNVWQEVLIPLDYFSPPVDLTKLTELQIAFEWKPMSGQVYLDNISFVTLQNYLPIALNGEELTCSDTLPSCSDPYSNYEPNNLQCSAAAATFGLSSGIPIQSYLCAPDDADDYFHIDVTVLSPISVSLSNIPNGKDYDLYLYFEDALVAKSDNYGNVNETLSYTPTKLGRYYIRIYPYSGRSLSPYSLVANFQ